MTLMQRLERAQRAAEAAAAEALAPESGADGALAPRPDTTTTPESRLGMTVAPAPHRAPPDPPNLLDRSTPSDVADLSGSTGLAEAMEAEHYAAMLAELRALYQSLIPKHGGMVVRGSLGEERRGNQEKQQ